MRDMDAVGEIHKGWKVFESDLLGGGHKEVLNHLGSRATC